LQDEIDESGDFCTDVGAELATAGFSGGGRLVSGYTGPT
jgi:hypothetical protein